MIQHIDAFWHGSGHLGGGRHLYTMGITDAETNCILRAVQYVKRHFAYKTLHIFTDSQASILRVQHSNNQFSHQIRMASQGSSIDLQWCPGHVGIQGDELSNKLARNRNKRPEMKRGEFITQSFIK